MSWVCLMYHDVVPAEVSAGGGPDRFSVTLESFELMLDAIARAGMMGCSVTRALESNGGCVAITFDDATAGQYAFAAPALRARGMTATFFAATDLIGTPGFMTWDQLRELSASGMSIQSHTRSHPLLSELGEDRLRGELVDSKERLDLELGQDTSQIALPGGNAPRSGLRHLLGESGYSVVATSRWGRNPDVRGTREVPWIRRCTAPRSLTPELARRIIHADRRLTVVRYSREAALNGVRAMLGANRYARWRRRFLDTVARPSTQP